jgi:LPXTG-motif cell wall-anchored protein
MKPCYNCENRQMAAAGAVIAAAAAKLKGAAAVIKPMLPGATSAAGNAFARQKDLEWSAPDCGKRPFFIGKRLNEWEQCAARQKNILSTIPPAQPGSQSFVQKNKTPLIIGGVVLAAGVVYFLTKRKK